VYSRYDLMSPDTQQQRNPSGHYNEFKPHKPNSEVKCQQRMLLKLLELKKQNLLRKAFILESNEFEVLEFYGDAYMYERITKNILRSRRFMDPNLMTTLRRYCIKNDNLAAVFDQLGLLALLEPTAAGGSTGIAAGESIPVLNRKNKADIVEAIIGEIAEHHPEEDVLSELVAFISYVGEKEYFKEHHNHVMEPFSSRNSKRTQRNNEHRAQYDYNTHYNTAGNKEKEHMSNPNSSNLPSSKDTAPAPVFFMQNSKPTHTSPNKSSDSKATLRTEPIKILKRGDPIKTEIAASCTNNSTETSSGSPSPRGPLPMAKPNPPDNVFFRNLNAVAPTQIPSWVPNIASTRNGMDLKEKTKY